MTQDVRTTESLARLANLISSYRSALLNKGVPAELVDDLVRNYHDRYVSVLTPISYAAPVIQTRLPDVEHIGEVQH